MNDLIISKDKKYKLEMYDSSYDIYNIKTGVLIYSGGANLCNCYNDMLCSAKRELNDSEWLDSL